MKSDPIIDTNLRSLRFENDRYTMINRNEQSKRELRGTLCSRCARVSDCCHLKALKRAMKRTDAELSLEINSCGDFAPCIHFPDTTGIEGKFWNTLRLGTAWAHRVQSGPMVGLLNGDRQLIGKGFVTEVICGDKETVLKEHAYRNHLCVDKGWSKVEAAEWMARQLPNMYGNLIYRNNTHITAIYIRRHE